MKYAATIRPARRRGGPSSPARRAADKPPTRPPHVRRRSCSSPIPAASSTVRSSRPRKSSRTSAPRPASRSPAGASPTTPTRRSSTRRKNADGKEEEVEGTALEAYSDRFQQATKEPVTKEQCGRINADTLKPFDAVFFFTTGNPCETPEEMTALLDFVKSGKGFLGTHCATDTLYGMTDYGDMIGAYFDGHPLPEKTKIVVEDPKNPIMQGLGDSFEISDELYQFRNPYSRDKLHVLMRLDPLWLAQKRAEAEKRLETDKQEEARRGRQAGGRRQDR